MGWGEPRGPRPHPDGGIVVEVAAADHLAKVEAERDALRAALELIEAEGCTEDIEGIDLLCSEVEPADTSGWCAGCIAHDALAGTR